MYFYNLLTCRTENSIPAIGTARPAGLVQDYLTLFACPEPSRKNPHRFTATLHTQTSAPLAWPMKLGYQVLHAHHGTDSIAGTDEKERKRK